MDRTPGGTIEIPILLRIKRYQADETRQMVTPRVKENSVKAFTFWHTKGPILAIMVAYLALAITYSVITPVFEAPDEPQHFWFVKHLADGRGLPVQGKAGENKWAQEGSQPPLYYALAAALISRINTDDIETLLRRNPHANVGVPLREGNKNVYIHTDQEAFPYHGTALAVHLARWLSVFMGAGTVLATYTIMRLIFPEQPALAAGAAALNAFTPQFLFISGAINNDNLAILLASWTLWALLRLWTRPPIWSDGLGLGLLIGMASLAKLSGLGLVPLTAFALLLLWRQGRPCRKLFQTGLVALVTAAAVAGWWFWRNWQLYGDITGLNAMLDVFGRREATPGITELLGEAEGLRISYWAIFGWFNILSAPLLYKLLDALLLAAGAGLLLWTWRQLRTPRDADRDRRLAWVALAVSWVIILLAALIRWTRMTSGTQGRLLFPAIAALSGLIFTGLAQWAPSHKQHFVALGLGGSLFIWAALCPFIHIRPAYARPLLLDIEDIPADARPVHITYGDQMKLIAFAFDRSSVAPGETFHITAYWQGLKPISCDYSIYVHLFGRERQAIGQVDTYPGAGTYPTSFWQAGKVIRDVYAVTVSPHALTPVLAQVEIGPYLLNSEMTLPMTDGQGQPLGSPIVGRIRVASRHPTHYPISRPLSATFGQQIALLGYDLDKEAAQPGETIQLTLYWQALHPPDQDYTVFVHLVGAEGEMAGQQDSQPCYGEYPTSAWTMGEVVADKHIVQIKPEADPGLYRVIIGLYRLESGERLPTEGKEDYLSLAQIDVSW